MAASDVVAWILMIALQCVVCQDLVQMCQTVATMDCINNYQTEGNETLCASDGKTYQNMCFFVQEKCLNINLSLLYFGACETPSSAATTPTTNNATSSATTTSISLSEWEIMKKVFCTSSDQIACNDIYNPLCGTDGHLYFNDCKFAKAKCKNESLNLQDVTICGTRRKRASSRLFQILQSSKPALTSNGHASGPVYTNGWAIIQKVFCGRKVQASCDHTVQPVCASNGHVYRSFCHFARQRCHDNSLALSSMTFCQSLPSTGQLPSVVKPSDVTRR